MSKTVFLKSALSSRSVSYSSPLILMLLVSVFLLAGCQQSQSGTTQRIPVIYSTDLYHPPQDPDDHFDLAFLGSLEELDVKALIFDMATSHRKPEEAGTTALEQIARITGKSPPPWKIGLRSLLRSPDDQAYDQPEEFQGGVRLILSTLEQSEEQVVMFLVGSCRDFVVAFNRNPELLKKKVKAVYINAGNGPNGKQWEWNVGLDPHAYVGLMFSGLPIYWAPCYTNEHRLITPDEVSEGKAFSTLFIVPNQAKLLEATRPMVKNYFAYALSRSQDDPLDFLDKDLQPLPETGRWMWCTAPFLHAAGREIYQTQDGRWISCSPKDAKALGVQGTAIDVFRFEPIRIQYRMNEVDEKSPHYGLSQSDFESQGRRIAEFYDVTDTEPGASVRVFRYTHRDYNEIMASALAALIETL